MYLAVIIFDYCPGARFLPTPSVCTELEKPRTATDLTATGLGLLH